MPTWAVPAAAAFVLAAFATAMLWRLRARLPVATPNARSLHDAPIPRVAGVAIWAGFVPAAALAPALPAMSLGTWAVPWLVLFAVSLRDDMRSVGIVARLAVHAFAGAWFAIAVGLPPWLVVVATVVIGWSMNLYNFMDGSDGLAASMAIIGFAAYGIVLSSARAPADLPLCLVAATLPVLLVNRPPARMFLGDVGAVPLGFFAAALGIAGIVVGVWNLWFPLLVFLPFVADATATLLRRMAARERFWESHKSHHYQRLHQLGAGHAGTLAVFVALMLGCAASAIACASRAPQWGWPALAAWCAVHAGVFTAIDYHWRARSPS
jgi:UDP-N-acetylmuramyl pentapeptide phosphotransferase/UDP-N-acetylglucosamine-1-phosphate transferase